MLPIVIPPLIAAGAAIGSTLINAIGAKKSDDRANQFARESQERANQQNIEFWKLQNEYNSPVSQMERLRQAGLNPNLIYGTSPSSAVGTAGAVSPSKAAPVQSTNRAGSVQAALSSFQNMAMYADLEVKKAQTDNLKTQNTVLAQESALKAAQTLSTLQATAKTREEVKNLQLLRNYSVQAAAAAVKKVEAETIGVELNNRFTDQAMKNQLKRIFYEAQTAQEHLKGQELQNALLQLEKDLKEMGIEKGDPWYFRVLGRNWNSIKDYTGKAKDFLFKLNN